MNDRVQPQPWKELNLFALANLGLASMSALTASGGGGEMFVIPLGMAMTVGLYRIVFGWERYNWHLFTIVSIVLSVAAGTGIERMFLRAASDFVLRRLVQSTP